MGLTSRTSEARCCATVTVSGLSSTLRVLKAIAEREKTNAQLERELEAAPFRHQKLEVGDLTQLVEHQLVDLHSLLKEDVPRVKSEFRRLNLALGFRPVDSQPRAHYVVEGQCDLSALVFFLFGPADAASPPAWVRCGPD